MDQPAASDYRSNAIKHSNAVLQMQFENAYTKPNQASGDQLAALYFKGAEGPTIVKSNQAVRPTGAFAFGGSEPDQSVTTAGKKQF